MFVIHTNAKASKALTGVGVQTTQTSRAYCLSAITGVNAPRKKFTNEHLEKDLEKKRGQKTLCTAGEKWRQQYKTEQDRDKWSV